MDTLALEYIDARRTYSNDLREVFRVLGIEALREMIYNEMVEVMQYSGVYINYRHLSILCDRICQSKNLTTIYRTGILNDDIGPIAKSTFEVHTEVLLDAARHAELDIMRGVSANVMMGQYSYMGTNSFKLLLDMDPEVLKKMKRVEEVRPKGVDVDKTLMSLPEAGCSNIEIRNYVDTVVPGAAGESGLCLDDGYTLF